MIRIFALSGALMVPAFAAAEPAMTPEACRVGWHGFNVVIATPPRLRDVSPEVNADGWCQIDRSFADLRDNDFAKVVWRATGVEAAVEGKGFPESFAAEFTGIDLVDGFGMPLPDSYAGTMGTLTLRAERSDEDLSFAAEDITFSLGDLGSASFQFSGDGIDLSSLQLMQLTLGGLRLREASAALDTTEALSAAMTPLLLPQALRADLPAALDLIPPDAIDDSSRAALQAFVAALPDAEGRLDVSMSSETGLGFLQVVGGTMSFEDSSGGPDALAAAMAQVLTGVTITATWSPGG